ncbi:hypothetical protein SDC9_104363 [bioreactor metagenome]|uniref:Uncharacterized protein n=1 Tax=bioreactor metagenome TaxID=1076179 RepID=A0A645AYY9_9ZZZZ
MLSAFLAALAAVHLLEHFLHLPELSQQPIDIFHLLTASRRNTSFTRGIDDIRIDSFFFRHGLHNRPEPVKLTLIHFNVINFLADTRNHF